MTQSGAKIFRKTDILNQFIRIQYSFDHQTLTLFLPKTFGLLLTFRKQFSASSCVLNDRNPYPFDFPRGLPGAGLFSRMIRHSFG